MKTVLFLSLVLGFVAIMLNKEAFWPSSSTIDASTTKTKTLNTTVISFAALNDPTATEADLAALAKEILVACSGHGFFFAKDVGVGVPEQQSILSAVGSLFELPATTKNSISVTSGGFTRGYIGVGGESGSDLLEVKEAFSWGYNWDETIPPTNSLQGPNVWPDQHTEILGSQWRGDMETFYDSMIGASELIVQGLSLALGLEKTHFDVACEGGETISLLRAFHYFPYDTAGDTQPGVTRIGSSPHTDWGFLTVILQDAVSGIEAFVDGEWLPIPTVPDTVLVNCGDFLSIATEGRFVSPLHRVSIQDEERTSLVLFYYPNYETTLDLPKQAGQKHSLLDDQHAATGAPGTAQGTHEEVSSLAFGEYIRKKWAQVFREA